MVHSAVHHGVSAGSSICMQCLSVCTVYALCAFMQCISFETYSAHTACVHVGSGITLYTYHAQGVHDSACVIAMLIRTFHCLDNALVSLQFGIRTCWYALLLLTQLLFMLFITTAITTDAILIL
jgi:hypothetical protein